MDPSDIAGSPAEQDWDADDFQIPNLKFKKEDVININTVTVKKAAVCKEKADSGPIYLGPHGAPPSQLKQSELNTVVSKKSKRNQRIKGSDKKVDTCAGQENKVDSLLDLMGSQRDLPSSPCGTPGDWLDPHCQESQFERLA